MNRRTDHFREPINIVLAVKHRQLETHFARERARIALETSTIEATTITSATAGGDERRLRGIPAIGRGVAGHIPGTRP